MKRLGIKTILISSLTLVTLIAAQYFFGILSTKAEVTSLEQITELREGLTLGNDQSLRGVFSEDGTYMAFHSVATNLVDDDTNGFIDTFVLNTQTHEVERVSVADDGTQGNQGSDNNTSPDISADGRYVVFQSNATNLVAGDSNANADVFVYDSDTDTIERVSVATDGTQSIGYSGFPSISADGRYVAFQAGGGDLVAGDTNDAFDAFVHDRQNNTTERVSISDGESEANGTSGPPVLSADGRYVAFASDATNLVVGDTNGRTDIFVRDRVSGTTERVSLTDADAEMTEDGATEPDISADGRFVTFASHDSTLVTGDDDGGFSDVFVRDRTLGTTERISVATDGTESGDGNAYSGSISADGRYIAFLSFDSGLVADDTNGAWDAFVRDRTLDTTERQSVSTAGVEANGQSQQRVSLSPNARFVAFDSLASNLVEDDNNNDEDLFVRDRQLNTTAFAVQVEILVGWDADSSNPSISADNNLVAFESGASNIVDGDTNDEYDVFLYNRQTDTVERISIATDGNEGNGESYDAQISANGRYVTFTSGADNLVDDDLNEEYDVFVRDLVESTTERISIATDTTEGNSQSEAPSISSDGRYIVFVSEADNLVANDTNDETDIFLHDTELHTTERISISSGEEEAEGQSAEPSISGDGRYVTFSSSAENLVANDTNGEADVFLRDRETGETIRVSERTGESHGNGAIDEAAFSGDDQFIVFSSDANNLVEDDTNGETDIFVIDRNSGVIERVSVGDDESEGNSNSFAPYFAPDGRYVLFSSYAYNLVAGDTNGIADLFVRDLVADTTVRVNLTENDEEFTAPTDELAAISGDGNLIAFVTGDSNNTVAGDTNGESDVFVRNIALGTTVLVSKSTAGVQGIGSSSQPSFSSDGRYLVFSSSSENFAAVEYDNSFVSDIFIRDLQLNTTSLITKSFDDAATDGTSRSPMFSADGEYVVFQSDAGNLIVGQDDDGNDSDIFVYSVQDETTDIVSVSSDEEEGDGSSMQPTISSDGTVVAFYSYADNLVDDDTYDDGSDLFVRDLSAGTTERANVSSDEEQAMNGDDADEEYVFSLSSDGRYIAFPSDSLLADNAGQSASLYIRDRDESTTEFIIPAIETFFEGNSTSETPVISTDGNFIAFSSDADTLDGEDINGETDIFVYSRGVGSIELVSISSDGILGNRGSLSFPSISADGRYVAFYSYANNLVDDDENETSDVFLHDRETGETLLVSKAMDGTQISGDYDDADDESGFMVSSDGSILVFASTSAELISGDNNESTDIFLATLSGEEEEEEENNSSSNTSGSIATKIKNVLNPLPDNNDTPAACTSTSFDAYVGRGAIGAKVSRIQLFLKNRGFYSGPISGYFGIQTEAGVKKFQAQYAKEILLPWNLTAPTGFWGKTTRAMANRFDGCSEGKVPLPDGKVIEF